MSVAEFESDGYKLWVPTKSFAYERWTESIELFGEGGRGGTMLFTADAVIDALRRPNGVTSIWSYAFYRCLRHWASLRFDDTSGLAPSQLGSQLPHLAPHISHSHPP